MTKKLLSPVLLWISVFLSFEAGAQQLAEETNIPYVINKGQWESQIKFEAKIGGGTVWLQQGRFTFDFFNQDDFEEFHHLAHKKNKNNRLTAIRHHAYHMNFVGANPNANVVAFEKADYYNNYYLGNDPSKWASNVNLYYNVKYENLFSGIDLQVGSSEGNMKYDFIVHPGADASLIKWNYEGITPVIWNNKIILNSHAGEIVETLPEVYQIIDGSKVMVACDLILNNNLITLNFPNGYDKNYELIIDPTLIFSTYTGSTSDNWGYSATYDNQGNAYGGGIVFGNGFPASSGAYDVSFANGSGTVVDIALIKYNPTGTNRIFATYLGGSGSEAPHSLIVDSAGNLIVYGTTSSTNFPTTAGCYDNGYNGGSTMQIDAYVDYTGGSDIFVTKFNSTGTALIGSTYIGGSGNDGINDVNQLFYNYGDTNRGEVIIDDTNNDILVASCSQSSNFPTTAGALSQTRGGTQDGVVFRMNSTLTNLIWSTYLGGSNNDAAYSLKVSPINGDVYVCGGTKSNNFPVSSGSLITTQPGGSIPVDGFVVSLNNSGALVKGTYLGTSSGSGYDQAYGIEVDVDGDIYVMGQSTGNYPVVGTVYSNPGSSQFIHKLDPTLSSTIWSTVFGSGTISAINISPVAFLVDNCKNIYVSGWGGAVNSGYGNGSTNGMVTTPGCYDNSTDGNDFYCIVLEKNAASLLYATFFGGNSSNGEHVDGGTSRFDKNGTIYQGVCAGCGGSNSFPTTPGVWSTTNNSSNCNFGLFKMEFNYNGITASANASPNIIACDPPFNVNFTGSSTAVNNYWDFGDGSGTSTQANPSYTFQDTGHFIVTYVAIDSSSCNIADTVQLSVQILQSQVFDAVFNVPPYDPCQGNTLPVTFEFTGSGADSLVWNMGDGTTFTNDTLINYTYTSQGTYIVTLTAWDYTCGRTGSFSDTIFFNGNGITANAQAAPNVIQCDPPFDVTFSGGTTPNHYWDFGDGTGTSTQANPTYTYQDTGVFTVMYIAIDSSSCNIADTLYLTVTVLEPKVFDAVFNIPPFDPCQGNSLTVDFEFTGSGADSLVWDMGDGSTFINDTSVSYTYVNPGTYIVSMSAWDFVCGRTGVFTDTIVFNNSYTSAVAQAAPNVVRCDPPFVVNFTGGNTPDHYWDFGDGTGTSTQANPSYTFQDTGFYQIMYIAIDSSTCNIADTAYLSVTVLQPKQFSASLSSTPPPSCSDTVLVAITFTGTGADSLIWDMGDGTYFYNDTAINYLYSVVGTYTLSMTAFDTVCNKVQTISETITVENASLNSGVEIPNVFSPNGDGINNEFVIFYPDYPGVDPLPDMDVYEVEIYNRWGKLLFDSKNGPQKWDGKFNGNPVDEGVYFYIVKYQRKCWDNDVTIKTGHVTVSR